MEYSDILFFFFLTYKLVKGTLEGYITGGSFAQYSQYPHSIHLHFNCQHRYICGGSILNQEIVLTAAHCFEMCSGLSNITVGVRYGHENVTIMKKMRMKSYVIHENYSEITVVNDIALLLTRRQIELSDEVKRVIVMRFPPKTAVAHVAGWGRNEKNSKMLFKHVEAQIQEPEVCEEILGLMPIGTFCAGPIVGLGAAAQGDSGSALVIDDYVQIGLVSFNKELFSLVAYTNVSFFLDWITEASKRLYCET